MSFRRNPTAVDINGVAQGLEGVKGDPHRQQNMKNRGIIVDIKNLQHLGDGLAQEIEILVKKQDAQVAHQAEPQVFSSPLLLGKH